MSHEAFHWALRQDVPPTERFVLSILADRSNHEGVSWPGYNNLAALTGYAPRTIKRAVATLEALGLLEIEARHSENGRTTSNLYRLRLDHGRTLLEIVSREQRWRAERAGQAVLFPSEDTPAGGGDRVSPPHKSAVHIAVGNPVDKTRELSTGVTEDHPQGDRVSPTEGDRGSPLEDQTNQDPLIPGTTTATSSAVDKIECSALAGADTDTSSAPDGAQAVRQDGGGEADQRRVAEAHFAIVDAAFRRRWGAAWVKRASGSRRQAWLDVLAVMDAAQVHVGIAEATKSVNLTPPSAYAFGMLALPHAPPPAPEGPMRWPPASREMGRAQAARIRRLLGS